MAAAPSGQLRASGTAAAAAQADAHASARAAGVTIREPHAPVDFALLCELFRGVWQEDLDDPSVTPVVLHALAHTGNYVRTAYDGDTLVGGCVGFFSAIDGWELHSHIAGVTEAARGRSVGFALKMHQRAWALARGLRRISWTFDPLIGRNAYFNLAKLGARPRGYLVNFYGPMNDAINAGDETDRLETEWNLDSPLVLRCGAGEPCEPDVAALQAEGAIIALDRDASGAPAPGSRDAAVLLVAVPADIERLRTRDRGMSLAWRLAVRDVLGGLLADGAAVTGFARAGWYVVSREAP
ncbi:MAG: GNAT family N-acetyltransferase [Pseudonocardiales bacterium]|nr:MAG: GNAT family N-acetyltransferase [Pseudonocardiales bacterium]